MAKTRLDVALVERGPGGDARRRAAPGHGRTGVLGRAAARQAGSRHCRRYADRRAWPAASLCLARRAEAREGARSLRHSGRGPHRPRCRRARPAASPTCLLQRGAAKVYAIDVGTNQLAWKLRTDPRVDVDGEDQHPRGHACAGTRADRLDRLRCLLHRLAARRCRRRWRLAAPGATSWR